MFLGAWGGAQSSCTLSPGRRGAAGGWAQAGGHTESGPKSRLGFAAFVLASLVYAVMLSARWDSFGNAHSGDFQRLML